MPTKADVKIFVSHRIDLDSVTVHNVVYKPVRCGAIFDSDYTGDKFGDNTGANISQHRMKMGEFTVQYWAWKNVKADYYGLCHYRRYLSFAEEKFPTDEKNQVIEKYLHEKTIEKYRLNDCNYIQSLVSQYDAVVGEYADISNMYTPRGPRKTLYEHFKAYDGHLINEDDIALFLDTLEALYPQIGKCAREYFAGSKFRGYNCFILKKDLYFEFCEIEVAVLEALKNTGKISFEHRTNIQSRTYGFFAEWLYGVYLYYLETCTDKKIKELQLVFFENTEQPQTLSPIENAVPVVFLTNRYLLSATLVSIQSLVESKLADTKYDIIILHEELVQQEKEDILAFYEKDPTICIRFMDFRKEQPFASNGIHWDSKHNVPIAALFLPWLLPEYARAIFLHSDVIVKTDLSELMEASFEGNMLMAPLDSIRIAENNIDRNVFAARKHQLAMDDPYQYISTAVMAMNLHQMRGQLSYDQIMRYALGRYYPRDAVNRIFAGNIKILGDEWNSVYSANEGVIRYFEFMPKVLADSQKQAKKHPKVIHYHLYPKPWQTSVTQNTPQYWLVARNSLMYERLLSFVAAAACRECAVPTGVVQKPLPIRVANKLLPYGSIRRRIVKKIIPPGSGRWNLLKKIYYFFR